MDDRSLTESYAQKTMYYSDAGTTRVFFREVMASNVAAHIPVYGAEQRMYNYLVRKGQMIRPSYIRVSTTWIMRKIFRSIN